MKEKPGKNGELDLGLLKAGGFIKERGRDLFTVRLRIPGGRLSVPKLKKIAQVAEKYGGEYVHLSVRQSIELVHVHYGDFDAVVAELGEADQKVASCGARVRVPVACGGCEYNPNGLMDTQQSALEVDRHIFGINTGHHKFKVGFSGCPFDCPKAPINDVGFVAVVSPEPNLETCIACGLCAKSCPTGAIQAEDEGKPVFAEEQCLYCGDCIKVCPTASWQEGQRGYMVYAGGKWGRSPLIGTLVASFLPADQVVAFIEEVLGWYRREAEGMGRIRLGDVLLKRGVASLRERLQKRFPDFVQDEMGLPQVVRSRFRSTPQE